MTEYRSPSTMENIIIDKLTNLLVAYNDYIRRLKKIDNTKYIDTLIIDAPQPGRLEYNIYPCVANREDGMSESYLNPICVISIIPTFEDMNKIYIDFAFTFPRPILADNELLEKYEEIIGDDDDHYMHIKLPLFSRSLDILQENLLNRPTGIWNNALEMIANKHKDIKDIKDTKKTKKNGTKKKTTRS